MGDSYWAVVFLLALVVILMMIICFQLSDLIEQGEVKEGKVGPWKGRVELDEEEMKQQYAEFLNKYSAEGKNRGVLREAAAKSYQDRVGEALEAVGNIPVNSWNKGAIFRVHLLLNALLDEGEASNG